MGGGEPQNPEPQRPPKERPRIIDRAKSPAAEYKNCVRREWKVFNQAVENVKNAAAKEADIWRIRWSIWQNFADLFKAGPVSAPNSTDTIRESESTKLGSGLRFCDYRGGQLLATSETLNAAAPSGLRGFRYESQEVCID